MKKSPPPRKSLKNKKKPHGVENSQERKILYAPWRYSYIKSTRIEGSGGCVFCEALRRGVSFESLILFSAQTCAVFLNKFPYNNGHLMVIPHRHTADFGALTNEEFLDLHQTLKKAYLAVITAYNPQGVNVGMNLGRVAGAGIVDHLHYHLVPRWGGDTNFMPVIATTKVISENLEQTYEKLLPLFT